MKAGAMMKSSKNLKWKLMVLQFCYLAALSGFSNYLTLYLYDAGLSELQIGAVYAVGAPATLLIQPLIGKILDRFQNFRQMVVGGLLLFGTGVAVMPFLGVMPALRLAMVLIVTTVSKQFGGVFDLWTYRLQAEYPGVEYGKSRGVGSIGIGVATLVMGYLIEWWGFGALFSVTVTLLVIVTAASLQMPNPSGNAPADPKKQRCDDCGRIWQGPVLWYVASFLVLKISVTVIHVFSSLLVERLGGATSTYGLTILLCAITEVFIFTYWGRCCDKLRPRLAYLLCVGVVLVGSIWTSLAPNIPLFMAGRIMLTIAYAMYTIFNLQYIRDHVSERAQGRVFLTLSALSSGVGYGVSSLLGGIIMELGSPVTMAAVTGAITVAAFLLHFGAFPREKA